MTAPALDRGVARLEDLEAAPYNPRRISPEARRGLRASLERFGLVQEVVVNRRTGNIVGGHQRVTALRDTGHSEVPVVWVDLDLADERALNVALNNHHIAGEWDETLGALLAEIERDTPVAFEELQLGKLAEDAPAPNLGNTGEDEAPEVQQGEPSSRVGEEYRLGPHLLVCGDSVSAIRPEHWAAAGCTVFDPPWDAACPPPPQRTRSVLAFCDGFRAGDVFSLFGSPAWLFVWDCVSSWYTPNRPLRRGKVCLWYGDVATYNPDGAHFGDAGEQREVRNSRGSYTFKPDPRGKHLSDVFSRPITSFHAGEDEHHHAKPVDWMRLLIGNCSMGGVVDPYAGGGSSLIAAAQLGREWVGSEIDPRYCDVIRRRWTRWAKERSQDPGPGALEDADA